MVKQMSSSCAEHRDNLRLLAIRLRLARENLSKETREELERELAALEKDLELD